MTGRLAGKVALVTGAGSVGPGWGNGRAAAVGFAREGAVVIGTDRDLGPMNETAERIAEFGGHFIPLTCNAIDSAGVAAMVAEVKERFGRIDILVNNVGGSAAGGP